MANKNVTKNYQRARSAGPKKFKPHRFDRAKFAGLAFVVAAFGGLGFNFLSSSSAASVAIKDVTYCNGQKIDFYTPRVKKFTKSPLVIYIHGGGLVGGTRTTDTAQPNFINGLSDQGYTLASMDYRLLTQAPNTTAPVEDVLCAVRYVRANASALGIDPDRVALYGWSSGAQLALMAATLPANHALNKGAYLNYSSRPQAVVGLAGIYDFNWELANPMNADNDARNKILINLYQAMKPAELQPINLLSGDDVPVLYLQGLKDTLVNPTHTNRMEARSREVGARHQVIRVNNGGHGLEPIGGSVSPSQAQTNAAMMAFIDTWLKAAPAQAAAPQPAPAPSSKPASSPSSSAGLGTESTGSFTPSADGGASAAGSEASSAGSGTLADGQGSDADSGSDSSLSLTDLTLGGDSPETIRAKAASSTTKQLAGWSFVVVAILGVATGVFLWHKQRRVKHFIELGM